MNVDLKLLYHQFELLTPNISVKKLRKPDLDPKGFLSPERMK